MTGDVVAMAAIVGRVEGRVEQLDTKLDDVDKRLAVLEAVAITPARLTVILTVALSVASVVFGAIAALAVIIHPQ